MFQKTMYIIFSLYFSVSLICKNRIYIYFLLQVGLIGFSNRQGSVFVIDVKIDKI